MTVYIKNFRFERTFTNNECIKFEYYTGYSWEKLCLKNELNTANLTVYTNFILDKVTEDLYRCYNCTDKQQVLIKFNSRIFILEQLNSGLFKECTKLFR